MSFSVTPFSRQPCISHGAIHGRSTQSPSLHLRHISGRPPPRRSLALPNYHVTSSVEDLSSTLVQEIVRTSKQVPERYIQKEGVILPGTDDSAVWEERLLVDLNLLSCEDDSSSVLAQKELAKLHSAFSEWGCLQIINHGITSSFLDELHQVAKQFFAFPLEEKLKYSIPDDIYNGYGNSSVIPGDKKHDWNDRFVLTVYPEDQRKLNAWPSNPQNFGKILHEYSLKLRIIQEQVLKAMARSLDLEEGSFLNQHGKEGRVVSRFACYPPCASAAKVYGAHPHADTTTISILLPDKEVEGLEIQKDDEWFKVPIIPGALYVNLGDFAEVMSNGIFKSVVHRVLTNPERERISVNTFFSPEDGNEIEPANDLVNAQRPKLYKSVNLQTYKQLFFQSHPLGKRVIDILKI